MAAGGVYFDDSGGEDMQPRKRLLLNRIHKYLSGCFIFSLQRGPYSLKHKVIHYAFPNYLGLVYTDPRRQKGSGKYADQSALKHETALVLADLVCVRVCVFVCVRECVCSQTFNSEPLCLKCVNTQSALGGVICIHFLVGVTVVSQLWAHV